MPSNKTMSHSDQRVSLEQDAVNHSAKEFVNGMVHTNNIESVWAVLTRGHNEIAWWQL